MWERPSPGAEGVVVVTMVIAPSWVVVGQLWTYQVTVQKSRGASDQKIDREKARQTGRQSRTETDNDGRDTDRQRDNQ